MRGDAHAVERLLAAYAERLATRGQDAHPGQLRRISAASATATAAVSDLIQGGKVRATGASTTPASGIVEARWAAERRGLERFRTEQPPYSILSRGIEREVLPVAQRYGMGILVWGPLAQGMLTGRARRGQQSDLRRAAPARPGPAREAGRLSYAQQARHPEPGSERMMKAVRFSRFGGPEVLEIVDLPDPHPGPGQVRIAVRAAGVNPSDWKKRQGLMDPELPQTLGHEAAGVVDELGEGVADVAVGDRVFGLSAAGAAQAELAVLSWYAPIPPSLDFPGAAALPAAIETATRALDQLGVGTGSTLLINGASGSVGSAAVQLAVVRGARVIGTASPANHEYLRSLGAEPIAYGQGLAGRVRALAPGGVDVALDVAGSGVLPELIGLAGGAGPVVTVADFGGAQEHGVRFSSGDAGRAVHALGQIGELIESRRFWLPVAQTFPLAEVAQAHRVSEQGHVRGKLVLLTG